MKIFYAKICSRTTSKKALQRCCSHHQLAEDSRQMQTFACRQWNGRKACGIPPRTVLYKNSRIIIDYPLCIVSNLSDRLIRRTTPSAPTFLSLRRAQSTSWRPCEMEHPQHKIFCMTSKSLVQVLYSASWQQKYLPPASIGPLLNLAYLSSVFLRPIQTLQPCDEHFIYDTDSLGCM